MKTPVCLLAAAVLVAAQLSHAARVTVSGTVVNFGVAGVPKGIGGVTVTIKDAKSQQTLASTNTHPDGSYSVAVDGGAVADMMVWFNKLGYVQRNAQRPLTDPSRPQSEVRLLSEDASPADTAANIATYARSASDAQFDTLFSAVSSLPPGKKQDVVAELKLRDAHLFGEFSRADKTYLAAVDFNDRVKGHGLAGDSDAIKVYPNFGQPGTTRVSGSVANVQAKRRLEQTVKGLGNDGNVHSDIRIDKVDTVKAKQLDRLLEGSENLAREARGDRLDKVQSSPQATMHGALGH